MLKNRLDLDCGLEAAMLPATRSAGGKTPGLGVPIRVTAIIMGMLLTVEFEGETSVGIITLPILRPIIATITLFGSAHFAAIIRLIGIHLGLILAFVTRFAHQQRACAIHTGRTIRSTGAVRWFALSTTALLKLAVTIESIIVTVVDHGRAIGRCAASATGKARHRLRHRDIDESRLSHVRILTARSSRAIAISVEPLNLNKVLSIDNGCQVGVVDRRATIAPRQPLGHPADFTVFIRVDSARESVGALGVRVRTVHTQPSRLFVTRRARGDGGAGGGLVEHVQHLLTLLGVDDDGRLGGLLLVGGFLLVHVNTHLES